MNNKYYQIYIDSNMDLAASVSLKCSETARLQNQWVQAFTDASFDQMDPRTWKYYKNICGDYFPSDVRMTVTSLDSLTEIEFSKEVLVFHRATKRAYAFGTTYYKELVERYPEQELLIRGILYPAEMDEAIAAGDGAILAYPPYLVEETEPSLIPKLQDWINGFYRRWDNPQYLNTDNLYRAGFLGIMFQAMPFAIENIRLSHCFTHEAHSYHLQQYLASHSKLDRYLAYMTRSQAMFFYHNIAWIENNNGRNEIFDILLKRSFTDRNLPMGHFSLAHSTINMPDGSLTPEVIFNKLPLNTPMNVDSRDVYSLNDILNIEDELHRNTATYREDEQPKIVEKTTHTLNPNVPTKLLQSTVIDYTDSERYRHADIIFHHWLWLAQQDYYRAFISFTIPANGVRMSLTPIDAFAFYIYAFAKGTGLVIDTLPALVANRVQRIPRASLESMREVCEVKHVSDEWLNEMRAMMPPVTPMISLEAFKEHCDVLFEVANHQYAHIAQEEGMTARAQKEAAVARLWSDNKFTLGDYAGQNYADWFAERNIVVKDLSDVQLLETAAVILTEATGANLSTSITLKDIQRAMCNLLLDLSSYSIQIGLNINTGPVMDSGFIQPRPDDIKTGVGLNMSYTVPMADVLATRIKVFYKFFTDIGKYSETKVVHRSVKHTQRMDTVNAKITMPTDKPSVTNYHYMGLGVGHEPIFEVTAPNPYNLQLVPGMEHFLELTFEQQQESLVDTWAK